LDTEFRHVETVPPPRVARAPLSGADGTEMALLLVVASGRRTARWTTRRVRGGPWPSRDGASDLRPLTCS
jgi:hypothetical protein